MSPEELAHATPDVVGTVAKCEQCGTTLGPLYANARTSLILQCACGSSILEVWPDGQL